MTKSSKGTTKTTLVELGSTEDEHVDFKIIKVSLETHKELQKLGMKGETFDEVIKKLVKFYKEHKSG
jgi:hypothetical protein